MDELVRLGKILSDINRVKILLLLKREGELCVCEICDTLKLSQPLVSRHLKQMRESEYLSTKKQGKWIIYTLRKNPLLDSIISSVEIQEEKIPTLISCKVKTI